MHARTGIIGEAPAPTAGAAGADAKRKREEATKKGMSAEEADALARREAARQRVAQRTASGFGYV